MPADIIVYGLIAAGLVFWLRSILGTRHGEERERPNPYVAKPAAVEKTGDSSAPLPEFGDTPQDRITDLALHPTAVTSIDNKTAELGLLDIAKADKNFDITRFLDAAQDAFVYVVEGFAQGDRETLEALLAPSVYAAFEGAIKEREERGETMETEIQSIRKVQVLSARMEKRDAFVTIRFVADEIGAVRDKDGKVLSGHAERPSEMIDIWTFTRDVKSRDPRWLVAETRSDDPDDNELIPDTH